MRVPLFSTGSPAPLLCAAALLPAPALAQEATGVPASAVFELAVRAESEDRRDDAVTLYRALVRDPDLEIRTEAHFRLGMLFSRQKRFREAAEQFRAVLDEKPDAARVRLELARVLTELGDEGAARRELRQVQAGGLPPEVARVVNQFASALRSRRPMGASLELALVPDSNINRATDAQTLDTIIAPLQLSRDAREQSGIGARVAGQVWLRKRLSPALAIVPRASAQAELYRKSQFDDVSSSALLGIEWSPGKNRIQLSGGFTQRWYGGDPYARTLTSTLNWQHPLSRRTQLDLGLTAASTDYRTNDFQDGALYRADLGIEHAFNARSGGSVSMSATRQTAADPGYASWAAGTDLLYYREFGHTTGFVTASARGLQADQRLFLYPERRRDLLLGGTVGATFRALSVHSFAPVVRASFERNFSTIGIYDYRRIATTIGVTRAF